MTIRLGPVLNFRGCVGGAWKLSALVATDDGKPPALEFESGGAPGTIPAKAIGGFKAGRAELALWRYDFLVKQTAAAGAARYTLDGTQRTIQVPALDAAPRIAYASCNGFSSLKLMKSTKVPYALWEDLARKHAAEPFHLLLLGGDQLYTDSMWEELEALAAWAALPTNEGVKREAPASLRQQVSNFFRTLYPRRWSQPEIAEALACIPTLMMWDDHDIMDGWGSYDKALNECDVYRCIFGSAREAFARYQLQCADAETHPLALPGQKQFTLGCRIGPLAVLALDMRSERTADRVLSQESWKVVYDWLDALPSVQDGGPRHLFVMSSIPVIYPDFALLEAALGLFPGRQELEDDLKDHWSSVTHRQERLRFIHRLLGFGARSGCRVTLLSGDVHVGAVGVVRSQRAGAGEVINQLTSSGIVHPAPPGMVLFFLENVLGKAAEDDRDIRSEIVPIPGTRNHYIGARNWLALAPDGENRYWANWYTEAESHPYVKVIHPVDFNMQPAKIAPAQ